jgi:hypothetical protein
MTLHWIIFQNTTKWKELFSLKRTTYVLSSDLCISGLTPKLYFASVSTFSLFNITTDVAWYFHHSMLQRVWRGIFIIQYYNWCGVVFSSFNVTTGVAWYFHYSILQLVWRGILITQYYNWCRVVLSLFSFYYNKNNINNNLTSTYTIHSILLCLLWELLLQL